MVEVEDVVEASDRLGMFMQAYDGHPSPDAMMTLCHEHFGMTHDAIAVLFDSIGETYGDSEIRGALVNGILLGIWLSYISGMRIVESEGG